MEPNAKKTFEGLCVAASIINCIAVLVMFLKHLHVGAEPIGKATTVFLEIFIGFVIASILASPVLGLPYWLALLASRNNSKVARSFLYLYVACMIFAFLGHAGHVGVLSPGCAYYFAEMVTISLSLWILYVAAKNNRPNKY